VAASRGRGNELNSFTLRQVVGKKTLGIGFLWLFGLFAVFLAPAPVKLTEEKIALFNDKLHQASSVEENLSSAARQYMEADMRAKQFKVWFWRFRKEYRAKVREHQPEIDRARANIRTLERERDGIMKEAKKALGLWSEAGLEESRAKLWESFSSGKVFAQRQTFWDSLFTILGSRERDWVILLIQLLFTAMINYTVGAIMAGLSFILSLPSLLASFSPSWPSALLFFSVAVVAACSLITTWIALIFASGAAVAYTTTSFVTFQRLSYERQQEQIRYRRNHED